MNIFICNFYKLNVVNTYMFINESVEKKLYYRKSKLGNEHQYFRNTRVLTLRCDNCNIVFQRQRKDMDPNRINNNVFHVCGDCDAKRFAQRKGQQWKNIWSLPASSDLDISKL